MELDSLGIPGAFLITHKISADDRGYFSRDFCEDVFACYGIDFRLRQANVSHTRHAGTIRGFHFQYPPNSEQKLLRCLNGSLFDVIVDLRPESPTFLKSISVELSAERRQALLVPKRCAHGFQSLSDNTTVLYYVSAFYSPEFEGGLRWNDPQLQIDWPREITNISTKDAGWPLLKDNIDKISTGMSVLEMAAA